MTRAGALLLVLAGCGGSPTGGGDGGPPLIDANRIDAGDTTGDAAVPWQGNIDALDTGAGCDGIFNLDQVLRFDLTMSAGDWNSLKADLSNSTMFPAQLSCGGEAAVSVGVRRKRSGGTDKPGVKIDIDWFVANQSWHTLRKLSLENGISEGTGTAGVRDVLAEYLAWRIMRMAGAMGSRAAFVELAVNGQVIGTYTHVEVVDKRFLRSRLGDDSGWLYKRSGSVDDGYKTLEMFANPYEDRFCFFSKTSPCALPADLQTWLPAHLDLPQMMRFGGANAFLANTDSPLSKDNNYYWYDRDVGRVYFPWDLDTVMRDADMGFFAPTTSGGVDFYWAALFAHWEDDYDSMWTGLLAGPLSVAAIHAEIDRAVSVAGAKLEGDPALSGGAAAAGDELRAWFSARHATVASLLAAHP